jgi:hypothetical protein
MWKKNYCYYCGNKIKINFGEDEIFEIPKREKKTIFRLPKRKKSKKAYLVTTESGSQYLVKNINNDIIHSGGYEQDITRYPITAHLHESLIKKKIYINIKIIQIN